MGKDYTLKDKIKYLLEANQARVDYRWQDAINLYTKLLEDGNNDIEIMWILAQTYFSLSLGQSEAYLAKKALEWINKAIQFNPNREEFYVIRGDIFQFALDAPDYILAEQSYRKAISINSNSITARIGLTNLVDVPENVISLSEAITILEDAILIESQNPILFLRLGSLYRQADKTHESYIVYKRALLCSPPLPNKYELEIKQSIA